MADNQDNWWRWLVFVLVISIVYNVIPPAVTFISRIANMYNEKRVRRKMKDYLQEKYDKEFVVERVGLRSSRDDNFYQAEIYPKEIIGTNKENDDYYHASASVDKKSFGRLGGVGDSYELVNLKLGIEDALKPRAKEIFGERILMKIEAHYKRREPGNTTFWGYKVESYEQAKKLIAEDPENRMIELDLDVYVFDRIDSEQEKEKRRKDIFEFVQYLKEEELFEYLEMRVVIVDERVLAPSYEKYDRKIFLTDKVEEEIEGENKTVWLPPKNLRREMSKKLQKEIEKMSEEELLDSMKQIRKDELNYDDLRKWNSQHQILIYSEGILKERYGHDSDYERIRNYNDKDDINIKDNLEYVYIN